MAHSGATLCKVGDTWYTRQWIPKDLKPYFQKQELKRTLGTKSLTSARQLLKLHNARTEEVYTMIRTGMLSNTQIKELIEDYTTYALEKNHVQRVEQGVVLCETPDGDKVSTRALGDPEVEHITDQLRDNRFDIVSKRLDDFLSEVNLKLEPEQYKTLCHDLALIHIQKIEDIDCQRDLGDYTDQYYLREWRPDAKKQHVVEQQPVEPSGLLLSELIDKYVKEHVSQNKWKEKSKDQNITRLNLMLELIGDKPAKSVTRDDIIDCLDKLQRIPSNRSKKKEYRDLTISEILALDTVTDPLGVTTVKHHMERLSSLFKWAVRLGYINRNVAEGVAPRDTRSADEQRSVYSKENLQKLYDFFSPAPYKVSTKLIITEEDKWIVLLGMFTGARLDELCRLYKEDISQIDDVWTVSFVERAGKKTKTTSGVRKVPIHPQLIELGFLKYHAKVQHERLFPNLKKGRDGYSDAFGKKYQRINRQYITTEDQVFHSLRHNVTNSLKQAGVLEQQIGELVGHKSGSITMERYGKKYEPKVLLDVIKKLDYGLTY